jgi:hypothetical protein
VLLPTKLVVLVALTVAGCTDDGDTATVSAPDAGCEATVRDASFAAEVDEQVALLDLALARCPSFARLVGEMGRYPGIVGYEVPTFVELRCEAASDPAVTGGAACASFRSTVTTIASGDELVFVGETLDGRVVEVRPDADTVFVNGVPEVVQRTVDIANEAGCDGVYAQRDEWAARADEPGIGDEASVYAVHAETVARYIGCEDRPLPTTAADEPLATSTTVPAG